MEGKETITWIEISLEVFSGFFFPFFFQAPVNDFLKNMNIYYDFFFCNDFELARVLQLFFL